MNEEIGRKAEAVVHAAIAWGATLSFAESCTGGGLAYAITSVPGSSAVLERSFVTYSNGAKTELLKVENDLLEVHGAVSEQVARVMADGCKKVSGSTLAVSITGIAGPGGGSAAKPVGLVWFGLASEDGAVRTWRKKFTDLDRQGVREASIACALDQMLIALGGS